MPFMPYNTTMNASGGLFNMLNATNEYMNSVVPVLGGNTFAISLLIPAWFIIFLPLARYEIYGAFITASFVCWLISVFLIAIGLGGEMLFVIFSIMMLFSAVMYYLKSRQ